MALSYTRLQCPSCSRNVSFSNEEMNMQQCACGNIVERKEGRLISRGTAISKAATIIQPGSEGIWNDKAFKVTGRFRAWLDEAVSNFWTIVFGDGIVGYLEEGYGVYAIYIKTTLTSQLNSYLLDQMKVDARRELENGKTFILESRQRCATWDIEGETSMPVISNSFSILEFAAQDGSHIGVIDWSKDHLSVFNVHYVPFSTLQLTHLRSWEADERRFACNKCSRTGNVKVFPYSQSYACAHCGAYYSMEKDGSFAFAGRAQDGAAISNIPLGTFAELKGIMYEVIGFACKEENNLYHARWKEYTLFNPQEGYAFLSEYQGNWIYLRERNKGPVLLTLNLEEFHFNRQKFSLFNRYEYKTVNAAGEFPYNLFNDDDKRVNEFIAPPQIWIHEKSSAEGIRWFHGEYISQKALKAAFGENIDLPYKIGIGAVQPTGSAPTEQIAVATVAAILLLVFIHLASTWSLQKRVIVEQQNSFDSLNTVSYVTNKFELDRWRSNLEFNVQAPVDNSWFELNATLVNASTGTEYSLEQGVEYYHGYSEGESWTEGSTRETAYLNQIPAGTYYLQVTGTREQKYSGYTAANYSSTSAVADGFFLTVTYDTPNDRNLVFCLIGLVAAAVAHALLFRYYEINRWSNSPYSPYESDEDET